MSGPKISVSEGAPGILGAALSASIFDVSQEVALVTGASSGLGRRFAQVLIANGARVALSGRRAAELESAAALDPGGERTLVLQFDGSDRKAIPRAFDRIERHSGG